MQLSVWVLASSQRRVRPLTTQGGHNGLPDLICVAPIRAGRVPGAKTMPSVVISNVVLTTGVKASAIARGPIFV